jgi:purine-binding chemotaxis protein CheW
MTATVDSSRTQYATFLVGDHYLGIGVSDVQEVLREQPVTPVPLSPAVVAGLINLRGKIVPQLDMRRLLNLPPREAESATFSVVVRTEEGAVSLLVDEIDDVVELDASSSEHPPQNADPSVRALLLGVHQMPHRLLLVLDVRRIVDVGGE